MTTITTRGDPDDGRPRPGDRFADTYRVDELLGKGGMGFVFAAQNDAGERVAIKMLLPELANNRIVVQRFLQEGTAARRITSAHCVRVLDASSLPDGTPFLVMEHLEGTDLGAWLRNHGPVPTHQAVDWVLEACEALAEAHRQKTVHRDLKPANLFLAETPEGPQIKVLDFGISKSIAADSPALHMTNTAATLGTPHYMSPEQLKSSRDVDERTDLWSLGIILFELVVGKRPFRAGSLAELSMLILLGRVPPIATPGVPIGFTRVVQRCLRVERDERYASIADFATALSLFGSERALASAARIHEQLGLAPRGVWDGNLSMPAATAPTLPTPTVERQKTPTPPIARARNVTERLVQPPQTRSAPPASVDPLTASVALDALPSTAGVERSAGEGARKPQRIGLAVIGFVAFAAIGTAALVVSRPAPAVAGAASTAPPEPAASPSPASSPAAAPAAASITLLPLIAPSASTSTEAASTARRRETSTGRRKGVFDTEN